MKQLVRALCNQSVLFYSLGKLHITSYPLRSKSFYVALTSMKVNGGEPQLIRDPDVPVTATVPLERDAVQPEAKVHVQSTKASDGNVINCITL